MNKAIFLDRDGTINFDYGYLHKPSDLELLPGVVEALQILSSLGFMLIVVTNQSGIGRNYFTLEQYETFNSALCAKLKESGVEITQTMMCPHSPDTVCECRKPHPYMVKKAIAQHNICADLSYMFGDKQSDVECGRAAGVVSRLVTPDENLLYWANEIKEKRV